jgi:hypothetical protein
MDFELGQEDSDIMISMNAYHLSDRPQYAALSYAWGDYLFRTVPDVDRYS